MLRLFAITLLLSALCTIQLYATHIVGGEFELVHRQDYNYEIRLNQYFDHIHGNPGAEDSYLLAYIFRKRDDAYISYVYLANIGSSFVPYTNPDCQKTGIQLQTRKIIYANDIYLAPNIYNDPDGYYIVWERCCRNDVINNIRAPERSGQAFYLEFPPVVKNNQQFINSSPILFPALSDYAVVDQLYYVDFGGEDPDGDSLVYSLQVPLQGNSSPEMPVPNATPAPYQSISWANGFNLSNVIPGPTPLQIDIKGLIRVVPSRTGLYVFSVKCEEYRNNVKIGEVIRDFQLLVVEVEVGIKPQIKAKEVNKNNFYNKGDVMRFSVDEPNCFELWVTDGDENENIQVKAVPVNFSADLGNIFSEKKGFIADENDTLKIEVCLPDCIFQPNKLFYIDFIAMDDACSLPLMDTVRVAFMVEPKVNKHPDFIDPLHEVISAEINPDGKFELALSGRDDDMDKMKITIQPQGFELEDYGMELTEIYNVHGAIDAFFEFNPDCQLHDFSLKSSFTLFIALQDISACKNPGSDMIRLDLKVIFPSENAPEISTDLNNLLITSQPGQIIEFNVFGKDSDDDLINLVGYGEGFDFASYNMRFQNKSGKGSLSSLFSWHTDCANLKNKDDFSLKFVVDDRGNCKKSQYDTLSVRIRIIVPDNEAPVASIDDIAVPEFKVLAGNQLEVKIMGFDSDQDSIYLRMENNPQIENLQFEFEPVRGVGKVSSIFKWTPECSLVKDGPRIQEYKFNFIVSDLRCTNSKSDTILLTVHVEDLLFDFKDIQPYNVFTPNGDKINDVFEIDNLPPDDCENQFIGIIIFNRWGKMVFYDNRRDFKWDGKGFGTGVYYYKLKYTNFEYKGTVSILY